MIRIIGGPRDAEPTGTGEPTPEIGPQPPGQTEEPEIELYPPTQERQEESQIELHPTSIVVPKELAQEILPTIQYLYEREFDQFVKKRNNNPVAILLDPERVKTEREEQKIDKLVAKTIQATGAENRDEALKILYNKHLYAPPLAQNYLRLIRGLDQGKPIDVSFLEQQLQSRREHEDGMLRGEPPHWRGTEPPTKRQKKGFKQERDKMDRFLTAVGELRRQQQTRRQ